MARQGTPHNILFQRLPQADHTAFLATQPLRVYGDPGSTSSFRSLSFGGGPFHPVIIFRPMMDVR